MIQQINLYNPAFEDKLEFLSLPGALIAWGAALLLVVTVASYTQIRAAGLSAELAQEERARTAAQADVGRLAAQLAGHKRDAALESELKRLEAELVRRNEVMATLRSGVIGNTEGFAEYLRAFARQSFDGMWLTGLSVSAAGRSMVVEGRALQPDLVPSYVQRLSSERVMRGRVFAELEMHLPETKPDANTRVVPPFIEFRLATAPEPAAPGAAEAKR
ncbi:MAG: hypothetical protein ACREUQ_08770 [Burkholderiales bacterium]